MTLSNPSFSSSKVKIKKSNQSLSSDGRILVTRMGWLLRLLLISCLVALVFVSTLYLGIQNPREEPIYIYSGFLISFSIVIYLVGWALYRNPSSPSKYSFIDPNSNENEKYPLVSVIVPIYNQRDMIEIVIDAILNSTYDNVEIIAVNDGSIDGTKEILDSYEVRRPSCKLKIIHKKNGGKRKAVATGFLKSSGKYIVLIDSDSVIDKHAIKEFMNAFLSNPEVGAVAGHAKLLNAHRTFFTKCQDAWYDYEFNIYKACESFFGTVTCCCGCLAGYRREAIEDFMMFWHNATNQITASSTKTCATLNNSNTCNRHNNRGKNTKACAHQLQLISSKSVAKKATITTPTYKFLPNVLACRFLILSLFNKFLKSVASYDDSEDRALTSYSIIRWKSVYVSSAIVYTQAPEDFRGFIRQQKRWKKGHTRANLFVGTFLWLRNRLHRLPLSLIFYIGFGITFVSPILMVATLAYGIFILHHFWSPIFLALGFVLIGFVEGLDYKLRDTNARYWMYRPIINLIQAFIISWLVFYALLNYRKNEWLTR
jgi:hyaluronan synthase